MSKLMNIFREICELFRFSTDTDFKNYYSKPSNINFFTEKIITPYKPKNKKWFSNTENALKEIAKDEKFKDVNFIIKCQIDDDKVLIKECKIKNARYNFSKNKWYYFDEFENIVEIPPNYKIIKIRISKNNKLEKLL